MFDIVGKRVYFFIISGIVILAGIVSLIVFGLKPGIEFSSGSLMTITFEKEVAINELKSGLSTLGYPNALIQTTGEGSYLIRLKEMSGESKTKLQEGLTAQFGAMTIDQFDNVSPLVASETTRNAFIAFIVAAVGIMLYITFAYRKMPSPFHYGTTALIALAHDVLVVVGLFSILGAVLGWEIDLMFVTGILGILGYSDNNTVIIFDRIRENVLRGRGKNFEDTVNLSVVETLPRSLNTNLTTLFPIIALLILVGSSIQNLLVVLLAGIVVGTYNSVCIAPSLLVVWEKGKSVRRIGQSSAARA